MAYTSTQLAALRAAIATGALTVSFEGRTVTYRSIDDMIRLEKLIVDSLAGSAAARVFTLRTKRGLEG